ncbi:MAG: hypothetical protein JKY88_11165 [Pseudomonadales bacterium]|nr:hypothetical protein [Pseudomonadales bacterium]
MLNLKLLAIIFLLLPLWSAAAEPENAAESETAAETESPAEKKNETEAETKFEIKDNTVLPKATGKTLKEKKLSRAFEQFIPSEKISADNAVPFPVDI